MTPEKEKARGEPRAFSWVKRFCLRPGLAHVGSLEPLRTLDHLELHRLALGEAAEALHHDGGVVHEDVRRPLTSNEPKTLRVVEPLHSAFFHCDSLCCSATRRGAVRGAL